MTKSGILNIGDWIIVPEDNTIFITVIAGYDLYYLYTTGGIDGKFTQRNAGNRFIDYNSITYENSTYIFTSVSGPEIDLQSDYRNHGSKF